jgi:dTDP-4-dehydrorhamnose 3,5-epimerase
MEIHSNIIDFGTGFQLDGPLIIKLKSYDDKRGFFSELYREEVLNRFTKNKFSVLQENISYSNKNVLRGMHFQLFKPQVKLVSVLKGTIFDVIIDVRKKSSTFGKWFGIKIDEKDNLQILVPEGFAHGFFSYKNNTIVKYSVSNYYYPLGDRSINWNDPDIGVRWPQRKYINLSEKDRNAPLFKECESFI